MIRTLTGCSRTERVVIQGDGVLELLQSRTRQNFEYMLQKYSIQEVSSVLRYTSVYTGK